MPENNPTTATGNQIWILSFLTKPLNIETLPVGSGPGTQGEAGRAHRLVCFQELQKLLVGTGVEIINPEKFQGTVFLQGSPGACQAFKAMVEFGGFARMSQDTSTKVIY